jgi:AcrR family transcriptional regulator
MTVDGQGTWQADEIARMADHLLSVGLAGATLRPLARAAGTSDRMLVYRYGTREALLARLFDHLADRMTGMLDASPVPAAVEAGAIAEEMAGRLTQPALAPFRVLWLELVAAAARGDPAAVAATERILGHFHGWLVARLPSAPGTAATRAADILLRVEGAVLFSAAGATGRMLIGQAFGAPEGGQGAAAPSRPVPPVV